MVKDHHLQQYKHKPDGSSCSHEYSSPVVVRENLKSMRKLLIPSRSKEKSRLQKPHFWLSHAFGLSLLSYSNLYAHISRKLETCTYRVTKLSTLRKTQILLRPCRFHQIQKNAFFPVPPQKPPRGRRNSNCHLIKIRKYWNFLKIDQTSSRCPS